MPPAESAAAYNIGESYAAPFRRLLHSL
jgi:hypothetical protein